MAISGNQSVSVAMAAYNGEKFIADQIRSIFAQTHPVAELIITDDASTDNTEQVVRSLQIEFPLIRYFRNRENAGINKTFGHSIVNCSAPFIAVTDQDDIWMPDKIETLLTAIGTADAAYANAELVDAAGNLTGKRFDELMNLRSYHTGAPFLMGNCVPGHAVLMRADFAKSILPFPDTMMFDRWISFRAAAGNGINYADKVLVHYRQHESNVIGTGKLKEKRPSKEVRFQRKLAELRTMAAADIKDAKTKYILKKMIGLFDRKMSVKRSLFFMEHFKDLLVIKKKPLHRKILYSLKMMFKPNY